MATTPLPFVTEEQYLQMERESELRHEYLHGEVFAMSGGTTNHNRLSADLLVQISNRLEGSPCEIFGSDQRVRVPATRFHAYPDLSVVCSPIQYSDDTKDCVLNPILLVEVLSKSSRNFDRGEKFRQYQRIPSLQTYVLVEQDDMLVEVYTRTGRDSWNYRVLEGPDAMLEVEHPPLSIPLKAVYRRVEFPPAEGSDGC
ncbi:MAG: Uma2 family endonuclease [Bryobacterales bacterium]|nr:Uma2 family endonuclease [Bryobacterales bacterium]